MGSRSAWVAPAALGDGFVVQTWVMLHAPQRGLQLMTSPFRLRSWYLGHVLTPVVFEERFTGGDLAVRSLVLGVLALAVCAMLWVLASRRARSASPACRSRSVDSVVVPASPAGRTGQLPCARFVAQSDH